MARVLPFVSKTKKDPETLKVFLPSYFAKSLTYAKEAKLNFLFLEGNLYPIDSSDVKTYEA